MSNTAIDSRATDHMTGNRSIMSSFTHTTYSNSVKLADGSRTSVQGIGIATSIPTLHLSSMFY